MVRMQNKQQDSYVVLHYDRYIAVRQECNNKSLFLQHLLQKNILIKSIPFVTKAFLLKMKAIFFSIQNLLIMQTDEDLLEPVWFDGKKGNILKREEA